MKKIKIELKDIKKLQHLYMDIFSEEDEDYPNRRIVSNKERAVQRILDKITDKKFYQFEIWKVIQLKSWDNTDNTYKPICNRLRELGYEIISQDNIKQAIFRILCQNDVCIMNPRICYKYKRISGHTENFILQSKKIL